MLIVSIKAEGLIKVVLTNPPKGIQCYSIKEHYHS